MGRTTLGRTRMKALVVGGAAAPRSRGFGETGAAGDADRPPGNCRNDRRQGEDAS